MTQARAVGSQIPRPVVRENGSPFAHFQWNYGWGVWEQVAADHANSPGVVAAYASSNRRIPGTRQLDALMAAVDACGQAMVALEACQRHTGAAYEEPMKSALEANRQARQDLARAAVAYYRAKKRRDRGGDLP